MLLGNDDCLAAGDGVGAAGACSGWSSRRIYGTATVFPLPGPVSAMTRAGLIAERTGAVGPPESGYDSVCRDGFITHCIAECFIRARSEVVFEPNSNDRRRTLDLAAILPPGREVVVQLAVFTAIVVSWLVLALAVVRARSDGVRGLVPHDGRAR